MDRYKFRRMPGYEKIHIRGIVQYGSHLLKSWSTTQSLIAMSSGEAEFYGIVKGSSTGLGIKAILMDMGVQSGSELISINTDASAAMGMASRKGLGKVRHIDVSQLWIQQKVAEGIIRLRKVPGTLNLSNHLTNHTDNQCRQSHVNIGSIL